MLLVCLHALFCLCDLKEICTWLVITSQLRGSNSLEGSDSYGSWANELVLGERKQFNRKMWILQQARHCSCSVQDSMEFHKHLLNRHSLTVLLLYLFCGWKDCVASIQVCRWSHCYKRWKLQFWFLCSKLRIVSLADDGLLMILFWNEVLGKLINLHV